MNLYGCRNLFFLSGLLLLSGLVRVTETLKLHHHEDHQQQQPVEISLRQVLVPALIPHQPDRSTTTNHHHHLNDDDDDDDDDGHQSINNRGVDLGSIKRTRFGQRMSPLTERRFDEGTRASVSHSLVASSRRASRDESHDEPKKGIIWSQPDPRKSYSPPISMIKVYKSGSQLFGPIVTGQQQHQQSRARKLKIGETLKRSSSGSSSKQQPPPSLVSSPLPVAPPPPQLPAANGAEVEQEQSPAQGSSRASEESSSATTRRTKQATTADSTTSSSNTNNNNNNMVTLIKYVPVLLSVPANSVVALPAGGSSSLASQTANGKPRAAASAAAAAVDQLTTQSPAAYFGLYKSQLTASPIKLLKYQTSLLQEEPYKFANEEEMNQLDLEHQQHQQLYQQALLIQQQQQQQQLASSHAATNELNMIPTAASNAKLAYLPGPSFVAPASLIHQSGPPGAGAGSTSKALSAYAARFMSMLRPSSFLSSINTNTNNQATMISGSHHNHQPTTISGQQQPPQIYLLAPAESFQSTHLRIPLQRPLNTATVGQDSMMNQASKLQHSTLMASDIHPSGTSSTWMHQQPNGLICVHSLINPGAQQQQQQRQQAGLNKEAAYNQPVLVSPIDSVTQQQTTTIAPTAISQQLIDTGNLESTGFDYAPWPSSSTESSVSSSLSGSKSSQQPKKTTKSIAAQYRHKGEGKKSPAKLATQKMNKLRQQVSKQPSSSSSSSSAGNGEKASTFTLSQFDDWDQQQQQQQLHQYQQEEEDVESQQKLASSSTASESRRSGGELANSSSLDTTTRSNKSSDSSDELMSPPPPSPFNSRASRRYGNGTGAQAGFGSQFIPFTIRDKIDLPAAHHRQVQAHSRGQSAATEAAHTISQTTPSTNNPVVFDEPAEGEVELHDTIATAAHKQRYSWPPHWLEERRVRTTSFVSSSPSQSPRSQQLNKHHSSSSVPLRRPTTYNSISAAAATDKQIDYRRDAGSSSSSSSSTNGAYTLPVLMASSSGSGTPEHQQHRHWPPPFVRPSATFSAASDSRLLVLDHSQSSGAGSGSMAATASDTIRPAASQQQQLQVTTSNPMDGAATLFNGRETAPSSSSSNQRRGSSSNQKKASLQPSDSHSNPRSLPHSQSGGRSQSGATAESRLSSLLVSASRLPNNNNNNSNSNDRTVELVVDSSPDVGSTTLALSNAASVNESNTATTEPATTEQPTTKAAASNNAPAILENHSRLLDGNLFSNERQFGGASGLLEEDFGRISESLQTNPMDLIDLQNSRSSFELPSQLESLSMLSQGNHHQTQNQAIQDNHSTTTTRRQPNHNNKQHPSDENKNHH